MNIRVYILYIFIHILVNCITTQDVKAKERAISTVSGEHKVHFNLMMQMTNGQSGLLDPKANQTSTKPQQPFDKYKNMHGSTLSSNMKLHHVFGTPYGAPLIIISVLVLCF